MHHLWLVPGLPLLGFLLNGLLGKRAGKMFVSIVGPLALGLAFLQALALFFTMREAPGHLLSETLYTWIGIGTLQIPLGFVLDPLSGLYLLIITGVGFLIHVYSIGYMRHEEGYYRYFAYLNLFVFFMVLLVLGDNFLVMFIGWEGVGLCSYLLIGYYFEKKSAADAAKKAFIVNRIGDFGFVSAVLLIFLTFGSLSFQTVNAQAANLLIPGTGLVTAITLLLFLGATGKSAQIPLYVWLPDAMEGPTPVSALIHAATMVTAGLYMIARLSHLFVLAPLTLAVVAGVGAATALLAAAIAITQTDIKKVLAYSTVSQLGYMFLAMGVGAFGAGIFHVMTHAFFKALLFLAAGSVIHALHHEQNILRMGGLKDKLPVTYWTMLIGTIAIAGIPPLAGFFSKDEILWQAFSSPLGHPALWVVGFLTAILTAFYMFRMIYLTFYGVPRYDAHTAAHLHESPVSMLVPLVALAGLSIIGGFWGVPHVLGFMPNFLEHYFEGFFAKVPSTAHASASLEVSLMVASVVVALGAATLAYRLYAGKLEVAARLKYRLAPLHFFSTHKFFVDELYQTLIVKPLDWFSHLVLWRFVEIHLIDRGFLMLAQTARLVGQALRVGQSGLLHQYLLTFALGTIAVLWYLVF